jgi:hypothetical protein
MKRWVNDYKIAERVYKGYRPVIPLEIKKVSLERDDMAILMEMPDADYKSNQENNQIINDTRSPGGGFDLTRYVQQEFRVKIMNLSAFWFLKVFIRKFFNKNYIPKFN